VSPACQYRWPSPAATEVVAQAQQSLRAIAAADASTGSWRVVRVGGPVQVVS
jgi:hypothetical protein